MLTHFSAKKTFSKKISVSNKWVHQCEVRPGQMKRADLDFTIINITPVIIAELLHFTQRQVTNSGWQIGCGWTTWSSFYLGWEKK